MADLFGIRPDLIETVRHRMIPLIERGLTATGADRYYDPEWVVDQCKARDFQAWVGGDFEWLVITRILVYPRVKELDVFLIAGSGIDTWYPATVRMAKAFGTDNGCELVSGHGRKGWLKFHSKAFPDDGILTYRMAQEI